MGTMTGQDFIDELRGSLQNRADSRCTDANLLRWTNHAYWHMTYPNIHAFEDLQVVYNLPLATGTNNYDLSGIGYRILWVRSVAYRGAVIPLWNTPRVLLKPRNIQWYENLTLSSGPPRFFVLGEDQHILVQPVPSASQNGHYLTIRVYREAAALTDATTTVVPSYFDEVLTLGAQAVAEYRLGYRDRARETLEHYAAMLNDASPKDELEGQAWGHQSQMTGSPIMEMST